MHQDLPPGAGPGAFARRRAIFMSRRQYDEGRPRSISCPQPAPGRHFPRPSFPARLRICWYEKGKPLGPAIKNWGNIRCHPRIRGYPTEKPVALERDLITQSTAPGWSVLDPFCGSGNVGRAAAQLGRPSLLCDIDTETAESRLRVKAFRDAIAS